LLDHTKSWKVLYQSTLIVPVDVPSLGHAVALLCKRSAEKSTSHTILIRPGCYQESGTVVIPSHVKLTIQCIRAAEDHRVAEITLAPHLQNTNQPLFHVQPGASLVLRDLVIKHTAFGNDYWNGNSAILCGQKPKRGGLHSMTLSKNDVLGPIEGPDRSFPKTNLLLCNAMVVSKSGRGIVAIGEDVTVSVQRSRVEQCAATGIFMERAALSIADGSFVGNNGRGSEQIAAGQSNIFIDRGILNVTDDCCIVKDSVKALDAHLFGHADQIVKTLYPVVA
jgi:hypothetical protein